MEGYRVAAAKGGREARRVLRRVQRPVLVLADLVKHEFKEPAAFERLMARVRRHCGPGRDHLANRELVATTSDEASA